MLFLFPITPHEATIERVEVQHSINFFVVFDVPFIPLRAYFLDEVLNV